MATPEQQEMQQPLTAQEKQPLTAQEQLKKKLAAQAPGQQDMNASEELKGMMSWGVPEVQAYFEKKAQGEWVKVWAEHDITGERLVLLTAEDIKDLGIDSIGDRMSITNLIEKMKVEWRKIMRNQVKARAIEAFNGSCIGEKVSTCCGFFPRDPDKYTLTASRLSIDDYEVPRICGAWKCMCLGGAHSTDNIQLDQVRDVDTVVTKKGCWCCAVHKATIHIAVGAGNDSEHHEARVLTKELFLEDHEGEDFANRIFMAVEEYKSTFRKQAQKARV